MDESLGRNRARGRSRARGTSPAGGEAQARGRARQPARGPGQDAFPRGGTRERIQAIALELFAEQGYDKTSLREIAEGLGVTKAALYYHFNSKEDIVRSFTEDYRAELDEVIAWGASQPPGPAARAAILARYADIVDRRLPVIRFMEQNQAALHSLMSDDASRKKLFRSQFMNLCDLLAPPGAPLADRIRAAMAVVSVGMCSLLFLKEAGSPAELHAAVLDVACELAGADAAAGASAADGAASAPVSRTG
ncbi:MAG TPA: TetR/AcrR family transcriptional regulator [Streptosporangiaceae bacterium]|jgi:AcrR family transcriptional regulator|nr:TetR/AcrR family transcriptional regulator [Streptosporangiaceae bacterium]